MDQAQAKTLPSELEQTSNTTLYSNLYNWAYTYGFRTFINTVIKVAIDLYGDERQHNPAMKRLLQAHESINNMAFIKGQKETAQ